MWWTSGFAEIISSLFKFITAQHFAVVAHYVKEMIYFISFCVLGAELEV